MNDKQKRIAKIASVLVSLAIVVGIFAVVMPNIASYSDVRKAFHSLSLGWAIVLGVVSILNVATYAPNWMVALPGLSYGQSMEVTMAGTAVSNVVPLGGAASLGMQYGMFRSWGFETPDVSRAVIVTGIWNNLANLAMPLVGLLVLTMRGGKNLALEAAAKIGAVVLVLVLFVLWQLMRSDAGARSVGALADRLRAPIDRLRKQPVSTAGPSSFANFRRDSVDLIRRRWLALTLTTVGGVMFVYVVLAIAIRSVGIHGHQITLTEAFAAWASTRLLSTAFPVTPGGVGIVDIGLTAALIGFGGPRGPVVAAVLLYRVLTFFPPIVLGGLSLLTFRRHNRNKAAAEAATGVKI